MAKSIIKELIIVLLLCLAIIIVLGILLYEYVPMAKTLPNQVSYTTPQDAKEELAEASEVDESQVVMTYEVNSADLNNYKKVQKYKPGKANPFSSYEQSTSGTNTTENGSSGSTKSGNSNSGSSSSSNTTTGSSSSSNSNGSSSSDNKTTSGGKFFQDTGTK